MVPGLPKSCKAICHGSKVSTLSLTVSFLLLLYMLGLNSDPGLLGKDGASCGVGTLNTYASSLQTISAFWSLQVALFSIQGSMLLRSSYQALCLDSQRRRIAISLWIYDAIQPITWHPGAERIAQRYAHKTHFAADVFFYISLLAIVIVDEGSTGRYLFWAQPRIASNTLEKIICNLRRHQLSAMDSLFRCPVK